MLRNVSLRQWIPHQSFGVKINCSFAVETLLMLLKNMRMNLLRWKLEEFFASISRVCLQCVLLFCARWLFYRMMKTIKCIFYLYFPFYNELLESLLELFSLTGVENWRCLNTTLLFVWHWQFESRRKPIKDTGLSWLSLSFECIKLLQAPLDM